MKLTTIYLPGDLIIVGYVVAIAIELMTCAGQIKTHDWWGALMSVAMAGLSLTVILFLIPTRPKQ